MEQNLDQPGTDDTALARAVVEEQLIAMIGSYLCFGLLFRIFLVVKIFFLGLPAVGVTADDLAPIAILLTWGLDVCGALVLGAIYGSCWGVTVRWWAPFREGCWIRLGQLVSATGLLVFAVFLGLIHLGLVLELQVGLSLGLAVSAWKQFTAFEFLSLIGWLDGIALILAALIIPIFVKLVARYSARWRNVMISVVGVLFCVGLFVRQQTRSAPPALAYDPLTYVIRSWLLLQLQGPNRFAANGMLPGRAQMRSVQLIDRDFVQQSVSDRAPVSRPTKKDWNILVFIMESVGAEYVFDTSAGNEIPMPFLNGLRRQGWDLREHRATSNTSARAAFSIFTGLYPLCMTEDLAVSEDVSVPAINTYFPKHRHFLVHPSSARYYFPKPLLENSGFTNIYDHWRLPAISTNAKFPAAESEARAVDFLLRQVHGSEEPFLGIYWTSLPHYPYADVGEISGLAPLKDSRRELYYRGLRFVDRQLERIFQDLSATGKLDETLVLIVGDHGEAFGQHGLYVHTFGTFEETFRTPALFWQPKVFPPKQFAENTSHVDLLPTLLDACGQAWNPAYLQGESLFAPLSRRHTFLVSGLGDSVAAISRDNLKVSVNFGAGEDASAFDLNVDPGELRPRILNEFDPAIRIPILFRNYQNRVLRDYNNDLKRGRQFLMKETR
jgi:hypothetical protein